MKSVIILVMDALRYDRVNNRVTQNLMEIAKQGVFYKNWHSNNSSTKYSVPYMLCGEETYLPPKSIMLRLRKEGYMSVILFSSQAMRVQFSVVGWDQVIDVADAPTRIAKGKSAKLRKYLPWPVYNIVRKVYRWMQGKHAYLPYARASPTLAKAKEVMEIFNDKPYFLWIHLMDPHVPYYPQNSPWSHKQLVKMNDKIMDATWSRYNPNEEEINDWKMLYEQEIWEMDQEIGKFFKDIDWSDKVLILTSDHGDEFGEHGSFSHWDNKFIEELLHVPMIKINGVDVGVDSGAHFHEELPDEIVREALR